MSFPQALTYFLVTISCTIIVGVIFNRTSFEMGTKLEVSSYKYLIGCYMLFVISNGLCLWANYAHDHNIGYIFTLVNLTSLCACAFFWYRFIVAKLNLPERSSIQNAIVFMPLLAVILLISTSMFTKLIFYYSEDEAFTRGPLYIMLLIVPVFYIIYADIHIIVRIIRTNSPSARKEYYYLLSFASLPILAGLIDMLVPHLPVMELAVLISIVLFYVNFQDKLIYIDPLTGMNNRRVADKYLRTQLGLAAPDNPLYFFLADCDDFKNINDIYGHLEGDRALRTIGSELEKLSLKYKCYVARWGGDEFVLIARKNSIPAPDSLINEFYGNLRRRIREEQLPYDIPISVGYIPCDDSAESADDLFGEAERKMYRAKEHNKQERTS